MCIRDSLPGEVDVLGEHDVVVPEDRLVTRVDQRHTLDDRGARVLSPIVLGHPCVVDAEGRCRGPGVVRLRGVVADEDPHARPLLAVCLGHGGLDRPHCGGQEARAVASRDDDCLLYTSRCV